MRVCQKCKKKIQDPTVGSCEHGRFSAGVRNSGCQSEHSLPDSAQQLHGQQPSTYEKPEATSAVLGS